MPLKDERTKFLAILIVFRAFEISLKILHIQLSEFLKLDHTKFESRFKLNVKIETTMYDFLRMKKDDQAFYDFINSDLRNIDIDIENVDRNSKKWAFMYDVMTDIFTSWK